MRSRSVFMTSRSARWLHRLEDLRGGHLRREDLAPVGIARHHALGRAQPVVRRLDAPRRPALGDHLDRLEQEPARLDDGLVGGAEVLAAPIDDAPHALLDGAVLRVDPLDAREALGLLHLAIEQVIVPAVALAPEGGLIDVERPVTQAPLEPVLVVERLVAERVLPVVDHRVLVVDRDPGVSSHESKAALVLRRPDLVERQHEVVRADVHARLIQGPDAGVLVAVVRQVDDEPRRLAPDERVRRLEPGTPGVDPQQPMQDGRVRGVDAAFEGLEPVGLLDDLRHVAMALRRLRPGEPGWRRGPLGWPHVGPYDAAELHRRVRRDLDLALELELLRLVHHVDAATVRVVLPAVVDAAQAALLVAAEEERRPPVRAVLVEQPDTAARVAEGDQILAEQSDANGRTVGLGHLADEQRGYPVAAHRRAHGTAGLDTREQGVFFAGEHRAVLLARRRTRHAGADRSLAPSATGGRARVFSVVYEDRKSTRLNSSHLGISY